MAKKILVIIVLLVACIIMLANTVFYYSDNQVNIENDYETVSINVKCKKIYNSPWEPRFISSLSLEEILESVKEDYGNAYIDEENGYLYIPTDKSKYYIREYDSSWFLWNEKNYYCCGQED